MEYYFRVQRMSDTRLPKQVYSAEWKRPNGVVAVTPWCKYVQSLLCKYGVNVSTATSGAKECKSHINRQVQLLHADRIACESLQHSTLSSYVTHVHPTYIDVMRCKLPRPFLRS